MVDSAGAKAQLFRVAKHYEKTNRAPDCTSNRRWKNFVENRASTRQLPSGKRLTRIEVSRRWGCLVLGPIDRFQNYPLPAKGTFFAALADLLFIRPNDLASLNVHRI